MQPREKAALIESIGTFVAARIKTALDPFEARLVAIESREPVRGEKGDKGDPAEPVSPEEIFKAVKQVYETNPPEPGPPGPKGDKGDRGNDGVGEKGEKGDPAVILPEQIISVVKDAKLIDAAVKQHLLEHPPQPGPKGDKGDKGDDGGQGPEGQPGRDGIHGRDGLPGRDAAPAKDGAPGRDGIDGKDGLGFEDMAIEYDGERRFAFRFERAGVVKEFPFKAPIVIDRGVWKEGQQYERGDGVTWGGSFWIAQCDTTAKPETNADFRLAVKRGRDATAKVK